MEIKINCLRNGIEQGGVSKGPATLLDGYGAYLYDLYKPSDEELSKHPELADEPLGIVYPAGNVAFTLMKDITFISESPIHGHILEPQVQFVCSCFPPSMYREIFENGTPTNIDESIINYLKGIAPLDDDSPYFDPDRHYYYFTVIQDHQHFLSVEPDYEISLTEAYKLDTGQCNLGLNGVDKYAIWDKYNSETNTAVLSSTAYEIKLPIFCFLTPSISTDPFSTNIPLSVEYNSYFAANKLSKINEADLEYYKKSAVLIYKKDLLDFKNFCKKILSYSNEINIYSDTLLKSLQNPQN